MTDHLPNSIARAGLGAAVLLLAACAAAPPAPDERRTVEDRVRAPALANDGTSLQVYTLRNPAVESLERQAQAAEAEGDLARAEQVLERALRIDGRDPAALQFMAEIQLQQGRIDQAGGFAQRSWDAGPQVGALCERTLRTLIVVHERNSEWDLAQRARDRVPSCRVAPPERF
ncbi:tetratricopeptide repeat protein [Wenzhouxiangella sp. XN79A]|uniref:tetratricopeptide repeat protein n=1 Tax=Wenzhouxiangella sp. XN79A TaxID=2724193 RepID=UPI00144AA696|nr:tetratricopeptide repeat protein [Wenzhouxiangella sp. XN79A]NKI36314.1 tetratricopeptide repeat protein [Wenzhouxiangella sp. XN79A]